MAAIALSFCASLCWGMSDFAAGLKSRRVGVLTVLTWVEGSGLIVVMAIIAATGEPLPDGRTALYAALAGTCGIAALGTFYRALSLGTMSIVAPISATGVLIPVVVGIATGDTLSLLIGVGFAVTIGGVLLASREEVGELDSGGPNRRAILLAVGAAVGFGLYFTFADVAADGSVLWLLAAGRIVALPFIIGLAARNSQPIVPAFEDRWQLLLIGCADLAATGLYALATTRGALSVVSVIGALYPVVTVLLARGLLKERLSRSQAVGVMLAFAGIAAVCAG
ncbi:MAG: EamA family transporter [Solirubrobacteraceae bacterium]